MEEKNAHEQKGDDPDGGAAPCRHLELAACEADGSDQAQQAEVLEQPCELGCAQGGGRADI